MKKVIPKAKNEELPLARYFRKYADRSFYRNLRVLCIAGYLLWVLLTAQAIWAYLPLMEIFLCLVLTILMHVFKSRGCAFALCGYGVLGLAAGVIVSNVVNLTASVALGLGTASLIAFYLEWKKYRKKETQSQV